MGLFSSSKHSKHTKNDDYDIVDTEVQSLYKPFVRDSHNAPHALTAEEVIGKNSKPKRATSAISMSGANAAPSPLDALKQKMVANRQIEIEKDKAIATPKTAIPTKNVRVAKSDEEEVTLLDKCMPYILEGGAVLEEKKPVYTLESIDSIINSSGDKAEELLKRLNNIGNVAFDNLKKEPINETPVLEVEEIPMQKEEIEKTVVLPKISDIDNEGTVLEGMTSPFAPITATTEFEDISSGTKIIDLSEEIFETEKTATVINTDIFENIQNEYSVDDDYYAFEDAKRIGTKLLKLRRAARLRLVGTIFFALLLLLAKIPAIYDSLYANPSFFAIISTAVFAVISIINLDAFTKIKTLFCPQKAPEALGGILSGVTLISSFFMLLNNSNPYNIILFATIIMVFKCIAVNMRATTTLNNFKIIATKTEKFGIKFIDDRHITFAMAKNAVEGDVMLGLSSPAMNIHDFMKNSTCDEPMRSRLGVFTVFSLSISFVIAIFAAIYLRSIVEFWSIFNAMLCLCFGPTVFFTDIFPLSRAAKKLNRLGGMITGVKAADKLDISNAVALDCADIFPKGTITLFNMQVLDSNKIDDTILDAAAIAKQIGSPLYSIFRNIVKTQDKKMPLADTVKYEDRLGISGWVDNRHIFIGNRTLLEAHGIKTPDIEIDRKILRGGYFPVYIASDDKPCALLMVQYNVKETLAFELQRLSLGGVTLLINTCDPNLTKEMISDYFGIDEESVFVMGSSGSQLYQNATEPDDSISAPAAHRNRGEALLAIFNCATRIKRGSIALSVYHCIASVIMMAVFIYSSYLNEISPVSSGLLFICSLISLVLFYIVHLFNKP